MLAQFTCAVRFVYPTSFFNSIVCHFSNLLSLIIIWQSSMHTHMYIWFILRDENYMKEVYQYSVFSRPQLGKVPSEIEMLLSPTELDSPPPGQKPPKCAIWQGCNFCFLSAWLTMIYTMRKCLLTYLLFLCFSLLSMLRFQWNFHAYMETYAKIKMTKWELNITVIMRR